MHHAMPADVQVALNPTLSPQPEPYTLRPLVFFSAPSSEHFLPDSTCLYLCTLQELSPTAHRVVLSPHGLSGESAGPEQLFTLLSFLKPGAYEVMTDAEPHITDPEQQVGGWLVCWLLAALTTVGCVLDTSEGFARAHLWVSSAADDRLLVLGSHSFGGAE
jgi:hypothetical protein